jgi:transcriptional regulator with XRE-family HTH domain
MRVESKYHDADVPFGEKLQRTRTDAGLTLEEAADWLGKAGVKAHWVKRTARMITTTRLSNFEEQDKTGVANKNEILDTIADYAAPVREVMRTATESLSGREVTLLLPFDVTRQWARLVAHRPHPVSDEKREQVRRWWEKQKESPTPSDLLYYLWSLSERLQGKEMDEEDFAKVDAQIKWKMQRMTQTKQQLNGEEHLVTQGRRLLQRARGSATGEEDVTDMIDRFQQLFLDKCEA